MGDAGANHCLCTLPVQVEQALCFHVIRKGPAFPAVAFKLHYFFSNSLEKEKKAACITMQSRRLLEEKETLNNVRHTLPIRNKQKTIALILLEEK